MWSKFSAILLVFLLVEEYQIDCRYINFNSENTANIVISFNSGNAPALKRIKSLSFPGRSEKVNALKLALASHAEYSQANVQSYLQSKSISFKSLWIANLIYVPDASRQVVGELKSFPEVKEIRQEGEINRIDALGQEAIDMQTALKLHHGQRTFFPEEGWNLKRISVPEVWNSVTRGNGTVVASISGGAYSEHETLKDNFRKNYNWFDAVKGLEEPGDASRVGTRAMGIMVANHEEIGVAPEAQWITCQACNGWSGLTCHEIHYYICAEWILCPTRWDGSEPDCSKAPNVVLNAWGIGRGLSDFDDLAKAWKAADIVGVFPVGDAGPDCMTVYSPADGPHVIGVGGTDDLDRTFSWVIGPTASSIGPDTRDLRIKPDLVAPALWIFTPSSINPSYYEHTTTSTAAAAQVAGVAALILSAKPDLTVDQVQEALIAGVDTNLTSSGGTCGGIDDLTFPNHHFGHGILNAYKSLQAALQM